MPDFLDHPKFATVLRSSGCSNADVLMIKELSRHATIEGFNAVLRVINTAPENVQCFVTLGATALIELMCRNQLNALEADLAERIKSHEG